MFFANFKNLVCSESLSIKYKYQCSVNDHLTNMRHCKEESCDHGVIKNHS